VLLILDVLSPASHTSVEGLDRLKETAEKVKKKFDAKMQEAQVCIWNLLTCRETLVLRYIRPLLFNNNAKALR